MASSCSRLAACCWLLGGLALLVQVQQSAALRERERESSVEYANATATSSHGARPIRAAPKSRCPEARERELDECAARLGFLGDHSFKVPKNQTAMRSFCSDVSAAVACIQSYSRDCLTSFTRQLMGSLLRQGKHQYGLICNNDKTRSEFMKKMGCMADDKIDQFHQCMDGSVARFEYIASSVKSEARFPAMCCSYQIFNQEVDRTVSELCGKPEKQRGSTNEYIAKLVGGTAGEFFGLICDGHRSLEECKSSKKTATVFPQLEETTRQMSAGKIKNRNKSLIPVLLEILDSESKRTA